MKTLLYETEFWEIDLLDDQSYLGRCYISLKRECSHLSDVSSEEMVDFHKNVVCKLEKALRAVFGATMFNWTCLMNNAYKQENPKAQVHWHFRPRYSQPVVFDNKEYVDVEFAHHYTKVRFEIVSESTLEKLRDQILSSF